MNETKDPSNEPTGVVVNYNIWFAFKKYYISLPQLKLARSEKSQSVSTWLMVILITLTFNNLIKVARSEKSQSVSTWLMVNQFALHDLCDENHKRQVEARVQTLLEAVTTIPLK
jgi:hypothetical protein